MLKTRWDFQGGQEKIKGSWCAVYYCVAVGAVYCVEHNFVEFPGVK